MGGQQQTVPAEPAKPAQDQVAPAQPASPMTPAPTETAPSQTALQPTQAVPPAPAAPTDVAQTPAPAQPAQPAVATAQAPASSADQVAAVVTHDFGSYDKDANGALDQTEFAAWMDALRKASDPSFQPGTPAAQTWISQAFAQADSDKSKTVNQGELTTFLTPKAS